MTGSSSFAQALAAKMKQHLEQAELAREKRMLFEAERRMMAGRDCQFELKEPSTPQPSTSEAFALMREPNPNYIYVNARTYAQLQKDIELCRVSEYLRDGEIQKGPVPPPPPNYFAQAADAARASGFPKSAEEFARYAANRERLRIDD